MINITFARMTSGSGLGVLTPASPPASASPASSAVPRTLSPDYSPGAQSGGGDRGLSL
jgi:hypothetical protein